MLVTLRSFIVLGLSLIVGLGLFGVQIVRAVMKGREFDRYLTVKGLSEKEVKATLALWTIRFSVGAVEIPDRDAASPELKVLRVVTTVDLFLK